MGYSDTSEAVSKPNGELSATTADELATVVMRAQAFTSATGAAIALTENGAMVCRASSGTTAPDVGVRLSIEGSFTGLAVTSGAALRCDDSETDPRVDAVACRIMRTRSICVVPVRDAGSVVGVLAAFSSNPNAFGEYHMAVLRTMADLISQSLAGDRARSAAESSSAAALKSAAAPLKPVAVPSRTVTPPPAARIVTPLATRTVTPPSAPARVTPPPKVAAPPPAAKTPAPPKEKREERIPSAAKTEKADPVRAPLLGSERGSIFAAAGEDKAEPGGRNTVIFGGGAVAVVVLAIVVWLVFGASKASTKAASATTPPAAAVPAVTAPPAAAPTEKVTESTTSPAAAKPAEAERRREPPSSARPAAEKPAPPQPAPVMVAGGSLPAKPAPSASDVAAPKLLPAGGAPALPALASATPAVPTLRAVTVPPRLLARVNPVFPETAKQMGLHGTVSLEVKVNRRGVVTDVHPISGNSFFYEAARSAIRQWKYAPQTVNGQPVDSVVEVTVNFQMPRQ